MVPEGVLASSYSNVGGLYSCSSQITVSSSVAVTEVQPFDRCTSGPPDSTLTLYTDASLTGYGAFLAGRTVSGVCEDCHLEEHINLLEMRAVLLSLRHFQEVIQRQSLLIATDNATVVAYLQNQGVTHSFSLYLLCREILLLCDSLLTVRYIVYPRQSESNSGCIILIPCSSEYGMGVTSRKFSSNHSDMGSLPDRSVCHQFELQTGDICLSNPRPESLGKWMQ